MKKSIFIMMMGLFALIGNSFSQIKLWNNGGIAIGDTTDPGSEKTVFYDDVEFNGNVMGISNIEAENTVNVNKKTFNITSTGWWQVAETNGGDHAMAIINVMDYTSSTHTSAKYLVTFQHGRGEIVQLIGDTYSTHGITGARILYNTSDRVYGGSRFEININRTGNFYVSIEDYNTTYSYSEWELLSSVEQASGWTELSRVGDPSDYAFATAGKVALGYGQTGDVLTVGTANTANTEGGLLIAAQSAGSSYFRYNRMSSWAGKTQIGNNASTTSDSPTTAIEIDGTSGSNVVKILGDINMSAAKDVTLPDNSELRFGDATKGLRMYSDGTYLRVGKYGTSALPFYITSEIGTTYIYSSNIYLGYTSGNNIAFRGNTLSADNWGIAPNGTMDAVKIGIGTTSPDENLEVVGNMQIQNANWLKGRTTGGTAVRTLGVSNTNDVYLGAVDNAGGKVIIREDGSDRITIVGGDVGIGDSTPSYKLDVNGTGRFTGALTGSTLSLSNWLSVSGSASFYSSIMAYHDLTVYGTFTEMSDRTLKTDISALNVNSLEKVMNLQGMTYRFINDEQRTLRTGFIAQDVQKIFPELVSELEDGLGIKTIEMIPHLVEAIKEQQEMIEEQKSIIADLDARLKALEGK